MKRPNSDLLLFLKPTCGLAFLICLLLAACQPVPASAAALNLTVAEAGVQRAALADLRRAGLAVDDPACLNLTFRGQAWPAWSDGEALYFPALPFESRYARQAVYQVRASPAPCAPNPLPSAPSQPSGSAVTHGWQTLTLGSPRLYAPQAADRDPWFDRRWVAPAADTLVFNLTRVPAGEATLTLAFWPATTAEGAPAHRMLASLNGAPLGEWSGSGKDFTTWNIPLAPGTLRAGENQLHISLPGLPGVPADILYMKKIILQQDLPLQALNGRLEAHTAAGAAQPAGFDAAAEVWVMDLDSSPENPLWFRIEAASSLPLPAVHLWAAAASALPAPAAITPARPAAELNASASAPDLIAIGSPELLAALQPLLAERARQGLAVQSASLQAVYDQFNSGLSEPQALTRFLQQAAGPNTAVLLVGDATTDPAGYLSTPPAGALPAVFIRAAFSGETISDLPLVDLDGDGLPDLPIGRLPARTPAQVSAAVQKILAFEQSGAQGQTLLLTQASEGSFTAAAEAFKGQLDPGMQAQILPANASAGQIFTADARLVVYFGHGSLTQWAPEAALTRESARALPPQPRQPLVFNFTCLAGYFAHPEEESLDETLLWQPQAGAVVVLAPTGLTLTEAQAPFSLALARALQDPACPTLGSALLQAWRQAGSGSADDREVMQTFLLLGDPLLSLEGFKSK
ncbi:MAG TPA: C25 family cysteine peptidase [Anaerolineaceae bacterium]|nr:C25 family cysteine peptidase [Anaerolineaceae bacterium]HPN51843.1 C25 family cysteine peptidase [Anaerolineaceae bacterium]